MCSGSGQIAQSDEALQKAQTTAVNTLNQDYAQSYAEQQNVLQQQQARLNAIAANPMGYSPQQLALAQTSINENTATAAKQAMGAAAAYAASHGGADVGSGVAGQISGQIASQAAQSRAAQTASLQQQNQAMKQQNLWSALGGLNQVGAQYGSAAGTATGASSSVANAATNAGQGALAANTAGWQTAGSLLQGAGGLAAGVGSLFHGPTGGSDSRLKTDIEPLEDGLALIQALTPVRYIWTELGQALTGLDETPRIGFLAQDVEAVIPEAALPWKHSYKSFDDRAVLAALVKSIQQLAARVQELDAAAKLTEVI